MQHGLKHRGPRLAAALLALSWMSVLSAQTRIVTFGGGSQADHNEISLEKNISFLRQTLADLGLGDRPHDVYFADAGASDSSVQYKIELDDDQAWIDFLAEVFAQDRIADIRYRRVELDRLAGPSNLRSLRRWFDTTGKSMRATDRLLFYFTGHGGADDDRGARPPRNTTLSMWDSPSCTVRQFERELDKLDQQVQVTLVMVQCHAGGFANVIYNDADPGKGFSKHSRCGFFATSATRMSAGCTPEIDEEDYEDFSTYFFAALSGRTRTGKPLEKPDYDGDGQTSLTDAFTHVVLVSNTIDIPRTTSDQLLRDKSRFRTSGEDGTDLLPRDPSFQTVIELATPAQKACLQGLCQRLELSGDGVLAQARQQASRIERERRSLTRQRQRGNRQRTAARNRLRDALAQRWPELNGSWKPQRPAILRSDLKGVVDFVASQKTYKDFKAIDDRVQNAHDRDDELEMGWVKLQRLLERGEIVVLAANLEKVADKESIDAYRALIRRENLTPASW
jgi:hypothetical protein